MTTKSPQGVRIWALTGMPEIEAGADVASLIIDSVVTPIEEGDIFVVTSKIVSKAEGRFVDGDDRADAITQETVRIVASRTAPDGNVTRIVQNKLGIVSAAAGVDASNTPTGTVLLLPVDPDRSARRIAKRLRAAFGVRVGVIISDTLGRPWREGQTDCAIGAGGVLVIDDLRGSTDAEGRALTVTAPCVGDELAAAADLVKGKNTRCPVAIVRGRGDLVGETTLPGASSIVRPLERDLFRLGTAEAYEEGFRAALRAAGTEQGRP